MRTTNRRIVARLALVITLLAVTGGPARAQETRAVEAAKSGGLEVSSVTFEATNHLERWLGFGVEGEVTATVVNTGSAPIEATAGSVDADGRTALLPVVTLAPGEATEVTTTVSFAKASLAEREIMVTVGSSTIATTHRTIPWLLIAVAALGVNFALLAGRNRLRTAVQRGVDKDPVAYATRRYRVWLARDA